MENINLIKNYNGHATYQITVNGKVNPKFMNRFNDLSISHIDSKGRVISILTGYIQDQEALGGVINILVNHQYTVISVIKLEN